MCRETAEEELQAVSMDSLSKSSVAERGREMGRVDRLTSQPLPGVRSRAHVLTSLSLSFLICKMGKSYDCVRIEWLMCLKHLEECLSLNVYLLLCKH